MYFLGWEPDECVSYISFALADMSRHPPIQKDLSFIYYGRPVQGPDLEKKDIYISHVWPAKLGI